MPIEVCLLSILVSIPVVTIHIIAEVIGCHACKGVEE